MANDSSEPKIITFPCDFPIKIVSKANPDLIPHNNLEEFVSFIVHKHVPAMEYIPINKNMSTQGNYQSVTVIIKAENQTQLDNIYKDLTANKNIIMVL